MVFFVAATMAIGSMSNAVGVAGLVSELMMPILQNVGNFGLILFAWLTGVITDMMMTPLAGMAAFSPLFIDIAAKLGLSVVGTTFSFVWGVEQLFFPYEWALFLILFSYDVFDVNYPCLMPDEAGQAQARACNSTTRSTTCIHVSYLKRWLQ